LIVSRRDLRMTWSCSIQSSTGSWPMGRDDDVAVDREFEPRSARAGGGLTRPLPERHALELDARGAPILLDDAARCGEELEADALVARVVDLAVVRAHLLRERRYTTVTSAPMAP